jgi:hypothetical protein
VTPPVVVEHDGILVVRDDLFAGGTKARFIPALFDGAQEVVYASPQEGGAQTALATVARALGKRATIFVAKRAEPHPRVLMAKALGARIFQVSPGYLSTVQARARDYCWRSGARLAPFGMDVPSASEAIAAVARMIDASPDEVWCAGGSGVLARGLAQAWPHARLHVVAVGRALTPREVAGGAIHACPLPFGREAQGRPPFPSDPNYEGLGNGDGPTWGGLYAFLECDGPSAPDVKA